MISSAAPIKIQDLQEIGAFANLPDRQLQQLANLMVRRTYAPGQVIFMEGEQARALWFVCNGRVKIIKQSVNGRVQGICLMNRGKCFGSCPLFDIENNPATAQALDAVTLFVLPQSALQQVGAHAPDLLRALTAIYAQRLEHLARISEVLGTWTVSERINDCLLTYAEYTESQTAVHLTHDRLASLSGTVREVVTRHLIQLEGQGAVRLETGRIIILDATALSHPCAM